jgi:hypothetical protein
MVFGDSVFHPCFDPLEYSMRVLKALTLLVLLAGLAQPANAAIVFFQLQGNAGFGLLGGNENPPRDGGSGGIVGDGIFFDDVASELTINVAWGSGNGFTDLTGDATAMHIHDAGSADFSANGGVLINLGTLAGFDGDAVNGGFSGTVGMTASQAASLFAGELYLNTHTDDFPGGEIRGNLTAVPEPSALGLSGLALSGLALGRQRRR